MSYSFEELSHYNIATSTELNSGALLTTPPFLMACWESYKPYLEVEWISLIKT